MEAADEILAPACIDRGLAADGAVHLRQQRGGDLHEVHAAQEDAGGKAGEIADDAAAQRNQHDAALRLLRQEPVHQLFQILKTLGLLA